MDKWFHIYGIPVQIHSDQGKSFNNEILDHLCAMYGVEHTMTAPYNPRGNSQCERFNRTMFNLLKTLNKEQKSDWAAYLSTMAFAYNATPHSSTGFQPYEAMLGLGFMLIMMPNQPVNQFGLTTAGGHGNSKQTCTQTNQGQCQEKS